VTSKKVLVLENRGVLSPF